MIQLSISQNKRKFLTYTKIRQNIHKTNKIRNIFSMIFCFLFAALMLAYEVGNVILNYCLMGITTAFLIFFLVNIFNNSDNSYKIQKGGEKTYKYSRYIIRILVLGLPVYSFIILGNGKFYFYIVISFFISLILFFIQIILDFISLIVKLKTKKLKIKIDDIIKNKKDAFKASFEENLRYPFSLPEEFNREENEDIFFK